MTNTATDTVTVSLNTRNRAGQLARSIAYATEALAAEAERIAERALYYQAEAARLRAERDSAGAYRRLVVRSLADAALAAEGNRDAERALWDLMLSIGAETEHAVLDEIDAEIARRRNGEC
jgi:hypothetical protein